MEFELGVLLLLQCCAVGCCELLFNSSVEHASRLNYSVSIPYISDPSQVHAHEHIAAAGVYKYCDPLLGTQAAQPRQNYLALLKLTHLSQGRHGKKDNKSNKNEESEDESADEDESEDDSMDDDSDADEDKEEPPKMHYR